MAEEIINPTEDELTDEAVSQFYEAFHKSFNQENSPLGGFLFSELRKGKKTIYNKSVRETKIFDNSFVDILRGAYPSLMKIVRDPKKSIRYDQEVVAMEKAKKVNSDSIRHLASHTQFIKSVDESGMVVPSKILTTFAEEELGLYENRFIKTLINRTVKFLEMRLDLMQKNLESYQADQVKYTNHVELEGTKLDVEVNVKVSNELKDEMSTAKKILYDVQTLVDLYRGLKSTPLYTALSKAKEVVPPIMKTNIILHNADFKIAYNVWVYLERTTTIGYNVDVKERRHTDSDAVVFDMDHISAVAINDVLFRRGTNGFNFKNGRTFKQMSRKAQADNGEIQYNITPKDIKMEHQEVSEFLLNQTAKYYGDSLENAQGQGLSYDMSLKKVYREMLDTINRVYPMLFDSNVEDLDVKSSTEQKLEEAKKQARVLKIVREQKQIDLNKMSRQEEKLKRHVVALEKKIKEEKKRQKLKTTKATPKKKVVVKNEKA